ncbi:MAG: hypothetical protein HOG73_05265 [Candidatus Marinimicrobia bacterium]|jgi:hypothetical protein|nr:hypothetical protein [Candidatus Neomarinimicrobiota bacterium]MBT5995109.1 hypothetical protein [Candidatus Neomarinimicrobiota bacterium]
MELRIISLDIETANLDMVAEGLSFSDPKGWRTSCVCIHNSTTDITNTYVHPDMVDKVAEEDGYANLYSFTKLQYHLRQKRNEGYTLLTHNGVGFDLPILSKSIKDGGVGGCASLLKKWPKEAMMDTCAVLTKATGERYRLNHLIHGLLGEEQSKLMDAANAPKEWAKGNYEDVIRYCIDDTQKTLAVYLKASEEGEFRAIGKESYRPVSMMDFLKSWSDMWEH